jgi:hypothetical protein
MGMRVRLKANCRIPSGFSAETRAIRTAMNTYGMIVPDNGSNRYVTGAPDDRRDNDALNAELAQVRGSDLQILRMDGLPTGRGRSGRAARVAHGPGGAALTA